MSPKYVSVVIQVNDKDEFVSESPYHKEFKCLEAVYHEVNVASLLNAMDEVGFELIIEEEEELPNKKKLRRQDYKKCNEADSG